LAFGETLFPGDLAAKVPEATFDAREAAKCLAYEVGTAAGFHIFRVLESVLRRYHSQLTGGGTQPKVRNIGVYLNSLRQKKIGDPKVLAILKQITDLYRNPLIHPEAALTVDEAISIFGISRAVIAEMLPVLPAVPPTTSSFGATAIPQP
jgi:hypothetical protein